MISRALRTSNSIPQTPLSFLVFSLSFIIPRILGQCSNHCSGHGICNPLGKCDCYENYRGGDCSKRKCPVGIAFSDVAYDIDAAHESQECSGRGLCNEEKGICDCMLGFSGIACERSKCIS